MKRKMTSAITGMSVTEVRRNMEILRNYWFGNPPKYSISEPMPNGLTVQEYCLLFVRGQHQKRYKRNQAKWKKSN